MPKAPKAKAAAAAARRDANVTSVRAAFQSLIDACRAAADGTKSLDLLAAIDEKMRDELFEQSLDYGPPYGPYSRLSSQILTLF